MNSERILAVTIVNDEGRYYVEVDDVDTNEILERFPYDFSSLKKANDFIENTVEKKYDICFYHHKEL